MEKVPKGKKSEEQEEGSSAMTEEQQIQEQQRLRKKATNLIKKQKLLVARKIVNAHDDFLSWGADARAKVGDHLINLFLQTSYIQFLTDQIGDGSPDARPAFVHAFRTVTYENRDVHLRPTKNFPCVGELLVGYLLALEPAVHQRMNDLRPCCAHFQAMKRCYLFKENA